MKQRLFFFSVVILSFFSSGCVRTYYPAIYHTSSYPMIFNSSDLENQNRQYYNIDLTLSHGEYGNEFLQIVKGGYTIADTRDYLNANPKIYGYAGNYMVDGLEKFNGPKSVFGLGGEMGFNLNFKISSLKIGLGISAGLAAEFGGYYNFRKQADSEGRISSEQGIVFPLFSVFPLISYEFSKSTILSTQINAGIPGFLSPSFVLSHNDCVYWVSLLPGVEKRIFPHRLALGFMVDINAFKDLSN